MIEINDPNYSECKCIELVKEAQILFEHTGLINITEYNEKIAQAISVLVIARIQRNGQIQTTRNEKRRARRKNTKESDRVPNFEKVDGKGDTR